LLTNVDVEARATSARKECARRPVLSEEVGDGPWAMALIVSAKSAVK
jgi:hypothetical protein